MCHTHVCVNQMSVFWMYETTSSRSDGTGLPTHAALYITYSMIGWTACLYETFRLWLITVTEMDHRIQSSFSIWQRNSRWYSFNFII